MDLRSGSKVGLNPKRLDNLSKKKSIFLKLPNPNLNALFLILNDGAKAFVLLFSKSPFTFLKKKT